MRTGEERQPIPLAWPLALGTIGCGILWFLYFVVPRIERGWADAGRQLSFVEVELVHASRFVVGYFELVLLALLGLVAVAALAPPRRSNGARP